MSLRVEKSSVIILLHPTFILKLRRLFFRAKYVALTLSITLRLSVHCALFRRLNAKNTIDRFYKKNIGLSFLKKTYEAQQLEAHFLFGKLLFGYFFFLMTSCFVFSK